MISVIIPTLNAAAGLPATLTALVPAAVSGLVREVIVVDGGSTDQTLNIIEDAGATLVCSTQPGRGPQLITGADRARQPWLLFLHGDTVLSDGWQADVDRFIHDVSTGQRQPSAAVFTFALDDTGPRPRILEAGVRLRTTVFRLPYGDQGLLIPVALYRDIGGFKPVPLMEDVDIVRRLGRRRIVALRAKAVTSAIRYKRDGYFKRSMINLTCLAGYFVGVSPDRIRRLYR